jgi:MFS family permease
MGGGGYVAILRTRHAVRLIGGTLLGRLPQAMALALMLLTRAEGGGYALAGGVTALYGTAMAVGQPLLGRAVDKRGQTAVITTAALLSAAGFLLFAAVGPHPLPVALAAVLVAGLFTPPLEAGLRALWPSVLRGEERVHAAYALDAAAQEIMFTGGPLLVVALVAWFSERAAVAAMGVLGLAGTLVVATAAPSRAWRGQPREAHWLGPLRSSGLRALFTSFFFVGTGLGAIAVAAVAFADRHGQSAVSGRLLAAFSLGALVGGMLYGARAWAGSPERRLRLLMTGLAVCSLPLVLVPGVGAMTALSALAGVFLAPVLACSFVVVDRHAPTGTVTEAFSWLVTAFGVGTSAGSAAVGPVLQHGGPAAGYGLAGAGTVTGLAVLLATGRLLDTPARRPAQEPATLTLTDK